MPRFNYNASELNFKAAKLSEPRRRQADIPIASSSFKKYEDG